MCTVVLHEMEGARAEVEKPTIDDAKEYTVCVSRLNGDTICEVRVGSACTVGKLRQNIEVIAHVPMREQQLSYSGDVLSDDIVLQDEYLTLQIIACPHSDIDQWLVGFFQGNI